MTMVARRVFSLSALAVFSGFAAYSQSVISAHSGVLHYSEGDVFLADKPLDQKYGTFPDIKENMVLRTGIGRAEVLLTPGVFLRVGENTSIRMITNRLIDTRVELIKGEAVVESDDPMKDNAVTIVYNDFQVHVKKASVLQFQSQPEQLKVFHGDAEVELNGNATIVKAGRMLPLTAALASEKFDARDDGTQLTRWSQRRSEYVATANLSAAKTVHDSGGSWNSSGWYYNPYFSMYTYIPLNGVYLSPYGYSFWSPFTVYQAYYSRYYNNANYGGSVFGGSNQGNYGYSSVGQTSSGYSGTIAASRSVGSIATAPSGVSSGATAAGASAAGGGGMARGGGSGGGRGK